MRQFEPGMAEFRLEAEPPSRPLCRRPGRDKHDQEDNDYLAPEDFGCRHESGSLTANTAKVGSRSSRLQDAVAGERKIGVRGVQKGLG
jgi:hypothetical protein